MNNANIQLLRRRGLRGVTLVEVLVVVTIMALIAGGVGLGVYKHLRGAQIRATQTNARQIRAEVKARWLDRSDAVCPSVRELKANGDLDRDSTEVDAWGSEWEVECQDGDVIVSSSGPDRRRGTDDDIRIPPPV